MKRTSVVFLLLIAGIVANAQKKENILLGTWKIVKTVSADPDYHLDAKDSKQFVGVTIVFKADRIIAPKNDTFDGGCTHPNYKFKIVNALKYHHNDSKYIKLIGCKTTNIEIVNNSTCAGIFDGINIIDKNDIIIGIDSYLYFLKWIN